jgi:hypothetical protein
MEAAGHPVASASRHWMNDRYSTTRNGSNVPISTMQSAGSGSHATQVHPASNTPRGWCFTATVIMKA